MATIKGTITVSGDTAEIAKEKIIVATEIIKNLNHKDLIMLRDIVVEKPEFVQQAKAFLSM